MKIGDRVGAILDGHEKGINFLGWGTYEGDHIPVDAIGWIAKALVEYGQSNPKILLDNGKTVWGCECWWGPEAEVRRTLESYVARGLEIVSVDIDQVRKDHKQ